MYRKTQDSSSYKYKTHLYSPQPKSKTSRSDKLKVYIKFRPEEHSQDHTIKRINRKQIQVKVNMKKKIYEFDQVFSPQTTETFEVVAKPIIENVFEQTLEQSHNNKGLIFVYGNTGTGKTHSMGLLDNLTSRSKGIVPESIKQVFELIKKPSYKHFRIGVSFCEVYMEQIWDLLSLECECKVNIREESVHLQSENITTITVKNPQQAYQLINIGLQRRKVAEQKLNRKSSRGHGVITIKIDNDQGKSGELCLIDLAGCERIKESQSSGSTLSEAVHINSSLSSLQTLLTNIAVQGVKNYRSSKLTRLLQPYIENGRINLLVTTSSSSKNAIEFARRCRGIKFTDKQPITPISQFKVFKQLTLQKQQILINCIKALITNLQKIGSETLSILNGQQMKSAFSFADITGLISEEHSINSRIQRQQEREGQIISLHLQNLIKNKQILNQLKVETDPSKIIDLSNNYTYLICDTIEGIGEIAQCRNTFKQQYFTAQMKVQVLQGKCQSFSHGIEQLSKYLDTSDRRVVKLLRDIGTSNINEDLQNQPHIRNKNYHKGDKLEKMKKQQLFNRKQIIKESHTDHQKQNEFQIKSNLGSISQRGAIFIDEI